VLYINVNQLGGATVRNCRRGLGKGWPRRCASSARWTTWWSRWGIRVCTISGLFPYNGEDVTALINTAEFKNMLDTLRDRF